MEKTAQCVLFNRCCYSGEIKLTGVEYRAHIHQTTNEHKSIIQQMWHTSIMFTLRHVWISVPWTLLRWSHGHHVSCCFSQLHIYYRMLLQLLVHFCRKLHLIQPFYNFWLTTNNVILNLYAYSNSMYIPNFIYLHTNNKY